MHSFQHTHNRIREEKSLSSREVEGNGPMKPGNPPVYNGKGANSGGAFRKMRGMCRIARPLKCRGFFVPFTIIIFDHFPHT
jgi:hypothetical protein